MFCSFCVLTMVCECGFGICVLCSVKIKKEKNIYIAVFVNFSIKKMPNGALVENNSKASNHTD